MESNQENISIEQLRNDVKNIISNTSAIVELFANKKIPLFLDVDTKTLYEIANIFITVVSGYMFINTNRSIDEVDRFQQATSKFILELSDTYEKRQSK